MKSPTEGLTPAQRKVLEFVIAYQAREGAPPTVREIAAALGFASTNTVACHLAQLRRKGHLTQKPKSSRGLRLLHARPRARIPILGRIAAGQPVWADQDLEGFLDSDLLPPPDDTFVLRVEGDSMTGDGIHPGDYVFVRRQSTADPGQIVVALLDSEATVKRFERAPDGTVRLVPSNPAYAPIEVRPGDAVRFEVLGVAVAVFRRLQKR